MAMKSKNRFFFWVLIPLWLLLTGWNLLTPDAEFSEAENRYLAQFPDFSAAALLDGRFMDEVNSYLSDQFSGRPYWVGAQSLLEYGLGKREINGVYVGKGALFQSYAGRDGRFLAGNVEGVNKFYERYGVDSTVMLVPSAASVQPDRLPALAAPWDEAAAIAEAYSSLSPGIAAIDAYGILSAHRDEYIYYRTDHHWTTYGASLAGQALFEAMGLDSRHFTVTQPSADFLGTLHSKTGFPLVNADTLELYQAGGVTAYEVFDGTETVRYDDILFPEYLEKKDKYSYLLGPVQPMVTIYTEAAEKERLLVFKDSYAHCLAPMLLDSFSEIRMVDMRFFNADSLAALDPGSYDKALFLYSADVFAHQLGTGQIAVS